MVGLNFTRPQYARRGAAICKYLTDREWSLIAPFHAPAPSAWQTAQDRYA